jgi:cytoskeleton protein RodZ
MTEQIEMPEEFTAPRGTGPQLRAAREKLGLSVGQMADRTRIPQRHIETIEAGDFASLPGRAYAVGFVRTLARESGLDQEVMVTRLREELGSRASEYRERRETYEPGDPSRAPSSRLVWFSVIAVLVLLAGLFMVARVLFAPAAELPALVDEAEPAAAGTTPAAGSPAAAGAVTFTALGDVWVRFTDIAGTRLMEGNLAQGESYTVPAEAEGARLVTGRPDLLTVTVGGRVVPPLSTEPVTVSNAPVDAASLLARGQAPQATSTAAAVVAASRPAASRPVRTVPQPQAAATGAAEAADADADAPAEPADAALATE